MLVQFLSLILTPVTGHNKRVVAVLHALVPVIFGFEHVESHRKIPVFDLSVLVNTQRPQYEHMNIVHQISSYCHGIRATLLCRAATRQKWGRRCRKGEHWQTKVHRDRISKPRRRAQARRTSKRKERRTSSRLNLIACASNHHGLHAIHGLNTRLSSTAACCELLG